MEGIEIDYYWSKDKEIISEKSLKRIESCDFEDWLAYDCPCGKKDHVATRKIDSDILNCINNGNWKQWVIVSIVDNAFYWKKYFKRMYLLKKWAVNKHLDSFSGKELFDLCQTHGWHIDMIESVFKKQISYDVHKEYCEHFYHHRKVLS